MEGVICLDLFRNILTYFQRVGYANVISMLCFIFKCCENLAFKLSALKRLKYLFDLSTKKMIQPFSLIFV